MKWLFKKSVITIVAASFALILAIWWWHFRDGAKLAFTTAIVKRGDLAATISATGTIEPLEVVDVGAQVAGRISIFGTDTDGKTLDYGSMIEQGALLAKIDDSV